MAVIVWAEIPILLDPIICHARQPSLVSYLPYNLDQELCQMVAGDAILADLWRKWRTACRQTDGKGSGNINIGAKANWANLHA